MNRLDVDTSCKDDFPNTEAQLSWSGREDSLKPFIVEDMIDIEWFQLLSRRSVCAIRV